MTRLSHRRAARSRLATRAPFPEISQSRATRRASRRNRALGSPAIGALVRSGASRGGGAQLGDEPSFHQSATVTPHRCAAGGHILFLGHASFNCGRRGPRLRRSPVEAALQVAALSSCSWVRNTSFYPRALKGLRGLAERALESPGRSWCTSARASHGSIYLAAGCCCSSAISLGNRMLFSRCACWCRSRSNSRSSSRHAR